MKGTAAHPQALVLGAAGTVGAGVVGALLEVGSPVLAVGREGPRMQALADRFTDEPGLEFMHSGCIFSDDDAARLARDIRARGRPLRAVFASLTSPLESGRLLDKPADVLRHKLEMDVIPHLAAARHLLPLLAESGGTTHYILVGGPFAERGWSGYGHASVTGATMRMMAQVLHEEAHALGVRVQLLSVDKPICTPANAGNACAEWPNALAVGRNAVSLLSRHGKPLPIVSYSKELAAAPTRTLFSDFPASRWGDAAPA
ncbi:MULTISPECIES: SDR family NAD(P)-dependent oxidoreductase [Pseudoxanthomonas]|uniref:SDR family NAD(P)-dependent oxidoreductase n=1 Tax=Pseudoxanthomonas TaxID=83618 RepID=UPI001783ED78|nr:MULTISPECIES: SDR family NAD(P)-dependent oxidoreductase [Pseudoxanthomonas]MBD9375786.1 SDR family NAD(P)-dependent oxidoreductase [Pseudoxanthomonas sp. PXM04]UBB25799.1 SDR family NAD(P)-dependent oxidoreductase [Pseudoxanthomonas japonensis]